MSPKVILAIILSNHSDFRSLARIAGGDPQSFYLGSNFDGADLRGEDLRGFNLSGSTFINALFDNTTLIDEQFEVLFPKTGTVKLFNIQKGFGFIQPDRGDSDVFVHITAVERAGIAELLEGQRLQFSVVEDRGKASATNIKLLEQDPISRKCIFCKKGNLSKEHIWPKWSHKLLPKPASYIRYHKAAESARASRGVSIYRERQGPAFNLRIRCVCQECNNGWMSALDNDAKPIFLRVASGENFVLSPDYLEVLTRWIVMKVMVIEQRCPKLASFTNAQRQAFYTDRSIPSGLDIRLFYVPDDNQHTAYQRVSFYASSAAVKPVGPNVSHTVLGFLSMTFSVYYKRDFARNLEMPPGIQIRLWPQGAPASWPLPIRTSKKEIEQVGELIPTLLKRGEPDPNVILAWAVRLKTEFGDQASQHVRSRIAELDALSDVTAATHWRAVLPHLEPLK